MKISVYDTYVQRPDGRRMHFDILVPSDQQGIESILKFGHRYLAAKGLPQDILKAEKCNYCHVESASAVVEQEIASTGFAIIEMENCT
jgi:Domain of unknown function (DUF2024)